MRIVSVVETWEGSDGHGFLRALRRMGLSVVNVDPATFMPGGWTSPGLRALRRAVEPAVVRRLAARVTYECEQLGAEMLFVLKGRYVTRQAVDGARRAGAVAVNFYPDVSFMAHGRHLPAALPAYDWVFTAKSYGVADMRRILGIENSEFLPHGFDPELHRPTPVGEGDRERYGCEVSFIGTWSPKKQAYLEHLSRELPGLDLRIWGMQWENAAATLGHAIQGRGVLGTEYVKAIACSDINLGLLSEAREGASSGDLTTARTFHIPATGSFMLHERTPELSQLFAEGIECAAFSTPDELVAQVSRYLSDSAARVAMAAAGRERCLQSGYSLDDRARRVVERARSLRQAGVTAT